jgi:hypothetical protein
MAASEVRAWRFAALALLVGVFFTAQRVMMALAGGRRPPSLAFDVFQEMLYWGVWALFCPLVIWLARRFPLDPPKLSLGNAAAHLGASLVLAPLHAYLAFGLHRLVMARVIVDPMVQQQLVLGQRVSVVWGSFMGLFWYWIMVALLTMLRLRRLYAEERVAAVELAARSAALEAQLARAQLDALRSQLHPHFLFNALNTISVLIAEQGEKARRMILQLASLLRRSLDEEHDEITLQQELGFLEDYLDIQRVRFGERLSVRLAVDPAVQDARVPVFLLQPLFENVIQHATWGRDDRTTIDLVANRVDGTVRISVEDNGPGPGPGANRKGIGLGNTRERLRHLYGDGASLTLGPTSSDNGKPGARVDIVLPYTRGPA